MPRGALKALIGAYDDFKKREKEILAHLPGVQIEWPVLGGKLSKVTVKKSDETTFTYECAMDGGGWVATLADPDGNYFQLVSPMG